MSGRWPNTSFPWRLLLPAFVVAAGAGAVVILDIERRARAAFEVGEVDEAIGILEQRDAADAPSIRASEHFLAGRAYEERGRRVAAGRRFASIDRADPLSESARFHQARVGFATLEVPVRALLQAEPDAAGVAQDARRLHADLDVVRDQLLSLLAPREHERKVRRSLQVVGELQARLEERFGLPPGGAEEGPGASDASEVVDGELEGEDALALDADRPGAIPAVERWEGEVSEVARRLEEVLQRSRQRERERGFPEPRSGEAGW